MYDSPTVRHAQHIMLKTSKHKITLRVLENTSNLNPISNYLETLQYM